MPSAVFSSSGGKGTGGFETRPYKWSRLAGKGGRILPAVSRSQDPC